MNQEQIKELVETMVEEAISMEVDKLDTDIAGELAEEAIELTEEELVEEDADGEDAIDGIDDLKEVLGQLRRFAMRIDKLKTPDEYDIIARYEEETAKANDIYASHYLHVANVPEAIYDKLYDMAMKINPSLILARGRVKSFSEIGEADCILYNKHRDYPSRALKRIMKKV